MCLNSSPHVAKRIICNFNLWKGSMIGSNNNNNKENLQLGPDSERNCRL